MKSFNRILKPFYDFNSSVVTQANILFQGELHALFLKSNENEPLFIKSYNLLKNLAEIRQMDFDENMNYYATGGKMACENNKRYYRFIEDYVAENYNKKLVKFMSCIFINEFVKMYKNVKLHELIEIDE